MILVIPTLHNQAAGRGLMLHGAGAALGQKILSVLVVVVFLGEVEDRRH